MLSFTLAYTAYVCLLQTTRRYQFAYYSKAKPLIWNIACWLVAGLLLGLSLRVWITAHNNSMGCVSWLFYMLPLPGFMVIIVKTYCPSLRALLGSVGLLGAFSFFCTDWL